MTEFALYTFLPTLLMAAGFMLLVFFGVAIVAFAKGVMEDE